MTVSNRLLDALPRRSRARILGSCERVELEFGASLCDPGRAMQYAYFPLSGFVSLVALLERHRPLELGLIGNEGMLGATLGLGIVAAPLSAVVQGAGGALRLKAVRLREALRDDAALSRLLNRYLYVLMLQLSQTAACLQFHQVDARLARWLLMTDDRSHDGHLHLTHVLLADMLGVRRSAVTLAAGVLQRRKLIRYARGEIEVLSRSGLEDSSCGCYADSQATYSQWLG